MVEQRNLTIDRVLQTVGGLLLTICIGISSWALNTVQAHEGRIIKLETEMNGLREILKEIKTDIKEIKMDVRANRSNP